MSILYFSAILRGTTNNKETELVPLGPRILRDLHPSFSLPSLQEQRTIDREFRREHQGLDTAAPEANMKDQ